MAQPQLAIHKKAISRGWIILDINHEWKRQYLIDSFYYHYFWSYCKVEQAYKHKQ